MTLWLLVWDEELGELVRVEGATLREVAERLPASCLEDARCVWDEDRCYAGSVRRDENGKAQWEPR